MKLTQEIIDKIQEAMLHTKKDGSINWKDDDEIVVQLAGTFAADRFIVIKNRTKDPVISAEPHPHFDYDKKNDTSNEFAIIVGETDSIFSFNFKIENIKIIPGAYDVVISSKLLSRFVNNKLNLTYYIALEPDSTFE